MARQRAERPEAAAETLLRDWETFVTLYDVPQEHGLHLRTSNAIASVFAGVRLRTDVGDSPWRVAKRVRRRENAVYLVWNVVERLGQHWRALNGRRLALESGQTSETRLGEVMTLVLAGRRFADGILQPEEATEPVAA